MRERLPVLVRPGKARPGMVLGDDRFPRGGGIYSDGVDLSGVKWALSFQLPGDFLGGIDKGRLYFDQAVSAEQRRELEPILSGKRGGVPEALDAATAEWLEPEVVPISIDVGDRPSYSIGSYGTMSLERIKTQDGKQAQAIDAPVAAGFGWPVMDLCVGSGSWNDPDLRPFESLGAANCSPITWSG